MPAIRSLLFAPASEPRKVTRLLTCDADAIVLDLEDSVATSAKASARAAAAEALRRPRSAARGVVRVNSVRSGLTEDDLDAVVSKELDAVVVPKTDGSDDIALVDRHLARLEHDRGLSDGHVKIIPLVETARGVMAAPDIARGSSRVLTLALGSEDLLSDVDMRRTPMRAELAFARSTVVFAAVAAQLMPAIDGPFMAHRQLADLRVDCDASRSYGFGGRVVIHPGQLPVVHEAYGSIAAEQLERARAIVEAFEEAERGGHASISVDGEFVDYPIYDRARNQLKRYGQDETRRVA